MNDPTEQCATAIAYIESGAKPGVAAVIFLHAMAGSAAAWMPQINALSDAYRCIAWDMPGFGGSEDPAEGADMDAIVETLRAFVEDGLGLASAHFVGLSVGGMILQHFSAKHPDLCNSLAILDSSPKFGFGGDGAPDDFAAPILKQLADGVSIDDFSAGMCGAIVGESCGERELAACIEGMARARHSGLALTTRLIAEHNAIEALPNIICPVLAMAGEEDAETPPAYAAVIAARVQRGNVSIIPRAGHISNLENAEAVSARLRVFLDHGL